MPAASDRATCTTPATAAAATSDLTATAARTDPAAAAAATDHAAAAAQADQAGRAPVLVFDGGCLFCRHFAELSELRGGIAGLRIVDGRADHDLRRNLERRGCRLRDGAVLIDGERLLHGAEAIQWLCARMNPSAALLRLLTPLLATPQRARTLYPLLLLARRAALAARGLPLDPGAAITPAGDPQHSSAQPETPLRP